LLQLLTYGFGMGRIGQIPSGGISEESTSPTGSVVVWRFSEKDHIQDMPLFWGGSGAWEMPD
jgi:hypothetical protein